MKAIIAGALVALSLSSAVSAQEQAANFTRISGRFVTLQVQGDEGAASPFRYASSRGEARTFSEAEVRATAAPAPQAASHPRSSTAPSNGAAAAKLDLEGVSRAK